MGFRRKVASLLLACLTTTGVSVGMAGPASAGIVNSPGYKHVKVLESGQCLLADAETMAVRVWTCLNTQSEEWYSIAVAWDGSGTPSHTVYQNHLTGLCMAVPSWPVNGTTVVLAPCDLNDVRQYWRLRVVTEHDGRNVYHVQSLQGAQCLDKPDGNNSPGVQLQMWTCRPIESDWNPFRDFHREQWFTFI
jgi:hypothetical protein